MQAWGRGAQSLRRSPRLRSRDGSEVRPPPRQELEAIYEKQLMELREALQQQEQVQIMLQSIGLTEKLDTEASEASAQVCTTLDYVSLSVYLSV